jgi:Replication-relaxation
MMQTLLSLTQRDREILGQLAEHEPLLSSELCLLFFTGARSTRLRLSHLEDSGLLGRVYPARSKRGGGTEALWFLTSEGRRAVGAPQRRPPGLSIPDLEHRRAVARFFCRLVERSLTRKDEGLWSWRGERTSERALGGAVRPDGFGRYLLRAGEVIFYLELDRSTESIRRVGDKLRRYPPALANDEKREFGNVLLVCGSAGRRANLAQQVPAGPPWFWGTTDGEHYRLLPRGDERPFEELPALPRHPDRRVELCLGKRWRRG